MAILQKQLHRIGSLCLCNHRLGANKSQRVVMSVLNWQTWTRMTDNLRSIHATDDHPHFGQSKSNGVKAE